ncbi:hypothetical protein [Desulfosarcina cetonica]|nr:hypothetical protein [Desulfosarcina cetonica]
MQTTLKGGFFSWLLDFSERKNQTPAKAESFEFSIFFLTSHPKKPV